MRASSSHPLTSSDPEPLRLSPRGDLRPCAPLTQGGGPDGPQRTRPDERRPPRLAAAGGGRSAGPDRRYRTHRAAPEEAELVRALLRWHEQGQRWAGWAYPAERRHAGSVTVARRRAW